MTAVWDMAAFGRPEPARCSQEDGLGGIAGGKVVARLTIRQERLVLIPVVSEPAAGRATRIPRHAHRLADLLLLPDRHRGRQVLDDEGELVDALPPVRGAAVRAELRCREEQLEQPERVLSQPQRAITGADSDRRGVRQP